MSNKQSWDKWELIAIEYLQRKNFIVVETNYKFGRFWEIDIIAKKDWYTYFFEVKYRASEAYGSGEESITKNKLFKIRKSAESYCMQNKIDYDTMKIEAIIVEKHSDKHRIKHYRNIEF